MNELLINYAEYCDTKKWDETEKKSGISRILSKKIYLFQKSDFSLTTV